MRTLLFSVLATATTFAFVSAADADRPGAPHLFPHDVLVYGRIDNATELKKAFAESSMGRMLDDPQLRPLAGDLYSAGAELFEQISDRVGVSLDELLSIPEGEVAVAMLPFEPAQQADDLPKGDSPEAIRARIEQRRRRNAKVGMIAILETGERDYLLKNMLDRLGDALVNQGYVLRNEKVFDTDVTAYRAPRVSQPGIEFCQRDGVTIFGIGEGVVGEALLRWEGKSTAKTLAQNEDFAAVMGPCVGAEATEPQITFFANPYGFGERFIKQGGGGGATLVWPILEELGFDKLKGVGASMFSGGEVFDGILHAHVLVQTPRDGLFSVLRPASGEITPAAWVADDVSSYTTLYWDVPNAYKGLERILDRFQGDGALERLVEKPLEQRLELNVQEEIIDQLTGRVTFVRWYEPPARLNSQSRIIAFEFQSAEEAQQVAEKLAEGMPRSTRDDEGNVIVYARVRPGGENFPQNLRRPEPRLAVLGNELLYCDSKQLLQRAIRARGGALPRLSGVAEFDLVIGEIGGQLNGQPPFLISFTRQQEMLRQFYDMASSPSTRQQLKQAADNNPVAAKLSEIMQRHELPPFDSLRKYFAPSGSFAYDSPTGIHYTTFTLRGDR